MGSVYFEIPSGTEKDDSERFVRWTDENNDRMEKADKSRLV